MYRPESLYIFQDEDFGQGAFNVCDESIAYPATTFLVVEALLFAGARERLTRKTCDVDVCVYVALCVACKYIPTDIFRPREFSANVAGEIVNF